MMGRVIAMVLLTPFVLLGGVLAVVYGGIKAGFIVGDELLTTLLG